MRPFLLPVLLLVLCSCDQKKEPTPIALQYDGEVLQLFAPGRVSTSFEERDFALSPDKKEIIFTRGSYDKSQRILVSIQKENDRWGKATMLPFSGKYQDIEPFFSPDGKQLYFSSKRPIFGDTTRSDYNIWVSSKEVNAWGKPLALDSVINTREDEFFPSVANNGNLYFTATYPYGVGSEDIFVSKKEGNRYLEPQPLDSNINTRRYEFNAWISPEEDMIVFSSYGRPDGFGGGDLYISKKDAAGNWEPSQNLGPKVNSDKLDYCPFFDLEENVLYFTSNRRTLNPGPLGSVGELEDQSRSVDNGLGNVYRVKVK